MFRAIEQDCLNYQHELAAKIRRFVTLIYAPFLVLLLIYGYIQQNEVLTSLSVASLIVLGISALLHYLKAEFLATQTLLLSLALLYMFTLLYPSEFPIKFYYWVLLLPILNVFVNRTKLQVVWLLILLLPLLIPVLLHMDLYQSQTGIFLNISAAMLVITGLLLFVKEFFVSAELKIQTINKDLQYQQKIVDNSVPILKIDLNGKVTYCSLAMSRILNVGINALIGQDYEKLDLLSLSSDPQIWHGNRKYWNGILYYERGDKASWLDTTIKPEFDAFDRKIGFLLVAENITRQQSLENQANHDQLTGALNRRIFGEFIAQTIEEFQRHKNPVCLVICDIDHFKSVNDTFGHLVGDDVLKQFYTVLCDNLRKTDSLARWGGEEFAILLPMADQDTAYQVVEKLRELVEQETWPKDIPLTSSFGLSQLEEGWTSEEWFEKADEALYQAKEQGRNQVIVSERKIA